ncbi:MAG: 1,4-alpha-glucan branching protein domain-containing protein [Elusimicrobiales bacterium]|jgi:1,4-alpha-glucan branching enzyme
MNSKGSLLFLLHAHLPYVNHPDHPDFLEENWFFEGVVETYIPLISVLDRLVRDGIRPGIAVSISPTLGAMLENENLEKKLNRYISARLELMEKELVRVENDPVLSKTVRLYAGLYGSAAEILHKYSGDLITPLKQFQHAGHIEIITTSATHSVLPLLAHPEALRAQIAAAADDYFDRFNRKASGFWLPECAYDARLQTYLKLSGFKYFFTESHAVDFSDAAPKNGVYASYRTPNGLNLFARDAASSREVWSAKFGYPGDPAYREFYRDLGYDADYDYIKPYLGADGARRSLGLKYHSITGPVDLSKKSYYDHDAAMAAVERHADDFLARRLKQVEELHASRGIRPVIAGCYDAELFGHWWFEGPAFLERVLRKIRQDRLPLQFVTPEEYLNSCQEPAEISPQVSSWGENGYFDPWVNESNDFIYPRVLAVTDRMIETANRFRNQDLSSVVLRALNQAAREVLLAQSSDWPFLMYIGSHSQYAAERVEAHSHNADSLLSEVLEKRVDEKALGELEKKNSLFHRLDFRLFASVSKF